MARHSRMIISFCIAFFILTAHLAAVRAEAGETPGNASSKGTSSEMVNVLAREIAFARSFSVSYPCQYQQEQRGPKEAGAITIDDIRTQNR